MAEIAILLKYGSYYYTPEAWEDYVAMGHSGNATEVDATREKVTVSLIDPNAGKLYYSHNGSDAINSYSRKDPGGTKTVIRYTNDGATSSLEYYLYFVNGACVRVYGAHPAHPGFSPWYTGPGGSVNFIASSAARYALNGALTHEEGVYETRADNLQSGTGYNSAKIVYYNSNNQIFFGANVANGKRYAVYAGYYWFAMLSSLDGVTPDPTNNSNTRTVADGKKRALITDIEGYNAGTASATVKASTGSLTFAYWRVFRQNLGDYETTSASRVLTAVTTTDAATGTTVILRAVYAGAGKTGTRYAIGADISEIVTRRPALTLYDCRFALYAEWAHRVSVIIDSDGQTANIYRSVEERKWYADAEMTSAVDKLTVPTKQDAVFVGYYTDPTGGEAVTDAHGNLLDSYAPEADATVYAHWRTVKDCILSKQGGSGGSSLVTFDSELGGFTVDGGTQSSAGIIPPLFHKYGFRGYFTSTEGGDMCIAADGAFASSFVAAGEQIPSVIYAQWERRCWGVLLNRAGGYGGANEIYTDGSAWYSSDELVETIDEIETPVREGYSFVGYFLGDALAVSANGAILVAPAAEDMEAVAQWIAKRFTLSFDLNGGTGSAVDKEVTFGEQIGALPTATRPRANFVGWEINGEPITEATVYEVASNATAVARWDLEFGGVTDYFGLASSALVPVSSTTGDTRHRVAVSHGGKYESGVNEIGGIWRNPSVTYVVKANTTVFIQLGKAWAATFTGSGSNRKMTVSGFMITAVEIVTEVGKFPTVTVSAVANEGANAVNNFTVNNNRFNVYVPVVARSKAQNLLNAISGGGYLQSCRLVAACDPVVCEENLMPCASDIVNGRYELSAETIAANREASPTMNGGFALIDDPRQTRESDYIRYTIEARKEMV